MALLPAKGIFYTGKHIGSVDLKSGKDYGSRFVQILYFVGIQYN